MIGGLSMNISIIGMPLFYGCDKPGVEQGPKILRENNVIYLQKNIMLLI